ncbi:glycoside hydrolase family 78 protein [Dictyobacter formicarum]|uniref:alpha-L-rhamnosidase n=1 Tax=Dictyobacter formicarum TaxID=2778368 RepID=A0ABQ3VUC8_9CHLR|nr:glycoside hydrolase family 78 protein [Dictyobacter formicarum]GHO89882.1 alpha-L-rhamnosidase [Dictyobacter formicarum]
MTTNMIPVRLRCEYLDNPSGIDAPQPRLNWQLEAVSPTQRSLKQTAYQILVSSSEAGLEEKQGDLWDSGKVLSNQSSHIVYAGSALTSGQQCWWRVRVWDAQDEVSDFSPSASWEMGLLTGADWQGKWIGLQASKPAYDAIDVEPMGKLPGLQASPYLRTTTNLPQAVRKARLYVTAKGVYEVHINGQRVGDAYFAPGWTDYHQRIQYQTYDVTAQLQQGENSIAAILGTGWYCGHVGFWIDGQGNNYQHYGTDPRLLLQLHIEYNDGSSQTIVSDDSWQGALGPIVFSDFLAGETYDARHELDGWDLPTRATTDRWQPVLVEELNPGIRIVAEPDQPIRVTQTLTPQTITEVSPGIFVYDMGQNMVGWVRLQVEGSAGTRVQLRFAEMLNPDGSIYTTNLRSARQTDSYILKGQGQEVFEPHFTFHGFRYVELSGYPGQPTLEALTGLVTHSDTPPTGSFECSNLMVNQLQKNIVWGQRGNFISVPTDCPQRDERLGWMGDAQIFVHTACYNMDVAAFFTKWMRDVVDAQAPDGGFPDVAPRVALKTNGAPAWGDAGIIVPWTIYQMYGDTRILEEHYEAMVRWLDYLHAANPELLWKNKRNNDYGDWLSIEADTPKELLGTAYFGYDALLMSRIARALGRDADAEKYQRLFTAIGEAFTRAYVDEEGYISGGTQTCYVVALQMQLLPEHLRPLAARHLVKEIEKKNGHLSTGFVGVGYLCPVLTNSGYSEVAFQLLNNETFPSWGYSIKHGATTIWERWDGWTTDKGFQNPAMNSFNHYSLGSVGQWLFQYVAGINTDPEQPGYQHIQLRPYPGDDLSYVKAEFMSIHGKIASAWQKDGSTLTFTVTIPANTTATIALPATNNAQIFEGTVPVADADGVAFVQEEEERMLFKIGSGTYCFRVYAS